MLNDNLSFHERHIILQRQTLTDRLENRGELAQLNSVFRLDLPQNSSWLLYFNESISPLIINYLSFVCDLSPVTEHWPNPDTQTPSSTNLSGSPSKYAVVVFIHGASFNWDSGNSYDPSIWSSLGKVIAVTLNYRLGILGESLLQTLKIRFAPCSGWHESHPE